MLYRLSLCIFSESDVDVKLYEGTPKKKAQTKTTHSSKDSKQDDVTLQEQPTDTKYSQSTQ